MNTEPLSSRRDLLKLSLIMGVTGILYGCGGGNTPHTSESSTQGSAQLRIEWPEPPSSSSRYLPQYAKSLVAELTLPADPSVRYTQTINRPDTLPATQTVTFSGLPAGKTYTLKCSARVERDGLGEVVALALASSDVTITVGQTTRASITLNSTIQRIEILGQPLKANVGDTLNLTGRALDASNNTLLLPPGALTWSIVSGSNLGTLTADGKLTASAAGTMRVRLAETAIGVIGEADIQIFIDQNAGLANSAWPKFRGNNQNTGRGKGRGATGQLRWTFVASDNIQASPVIGLNGMVYVASRDRKYYGLDGATGNKKWEVFIPYSLASAAPTVGSDGTVYIPNDRVYALDGATGSKKWESSIQGIFATSPTIGPDGTIYISGPTIVGNSLVGFSFYALDSTNGNLKWSFLINDRLEGSSAVIGVDGTVYFAAWDQKVYALDGLTGTKKWEFKMGSNNNTGIFSSPAIGLDGTIYIGGDRMYALDGATGIRKWEYPTGYTASSPAIALDGTVYIGGYDTKVYALDGITGAKKWEFLTGNSIIFSSPAIDLDGIVYIGSSDRKLYALDGITGAKKWEFLTGDQILASPAIGSDGTVYIGSEDNNVYAIR
jgi:eukaryotic-like serine/threonine-protein kinase